MRLMAIDPGPVQSAMVVYAADAPCTYQLLLPFMGILENHAMIKLLQSPPLSFEPLESLVIEQITHYGSGMPAGKEVFDTCIWIGRFLQSWGDGHVLLPRSVVKQHLCRSARATDANIRQALIDRFGPVGTKQSPGALYGVKKDLWSALAVAVTFADRTAA